MNYDLIYANAIRLIGRTLHWKENLKDDGSGYDGVVKPYDEATLRRRWNPSNTITGTSKEPPEPNLISSLTEQGTHAPALDIDFPIHAVPSSTPGHFHLYFEKEMSWSDYEKLLRVMAEVGLIEQGFYQQAMKFKQTYLRLPYVKKGGKDA